MRDDTASTDRDDGVSASPGRGADPSGPGRAESCGDAGRPGPAAMGALHAQTRRLVDSGDIDGLAAAMRADAGGLAERLARRARGGGR